MKQKSLAAMIGSLFPGIAGGAVSFTPVGAMPDQASLTTALQGINPFAATVFNAIATASPVTLTGAQMAGAQDSIINMTGTAGTVTVPTAALFIAALPSTAQVVGASGVLRIIATTGTWTVTTATGWTLTGTMTIAISTWRDFVWTVTGVGASAAVTLQAIGTGTQS
jgi:hypothetical protein